MQIGKNPAPRKYPKTASHFNYPISKVIPLPEPVKSPSVSFFDIINSRKSIRKFKSLDMLQISTLLWHSAKVREVVGLKNGHILTHRPSPSAGAIHPIDIFLFHKVVKRTQYIITTHLNINYQN